MKRYSSPQTPGVAISETAGYKYSPKAGDSHWLVVYNDSDTVDIYFDTSAMPSGASDGTRIPPSSSTVLPADQEWYFWTGVAGGRISLWIFTPSKNDNAVAIAGP
jgi:hypothetical protein